MQEFMGISRILYQVPAEIVCYSCLRETLHGHRCVEMGNINLCHWRMVSVYSIAHFSVDFACAFLVFRFIAGSPNADVSVLLYNFCAFALQMPIGIAADKLNRNNLIAVLGCVLVGFAFALVTFPILAVIVIGTGNALFHIGGGIDVLNISQKKLGALGVFVSPGALGIYWGAIVGKGSGFPAFLIPLAIVAIAGLMLLTRKLNRMAYFTNSTFSISEVGNKTIILAVFCLFMVVCLRSFTGLSTHFSWQDSGGWATVLVLAVVLGKTMGGFASDRFGVIATAGVSLGAAGLFFLFPAFPLTGIAAVLLFNMTMPITLWAMTKLLPGAKGGAFGLLTFALFIGFLPVYYGVNVQPILIWLLPLITVVSLFLLWTGLRRVKQ
ncbi:MAG: hypothetical protein FWH42_01615 [Dehalococcoidia bacterium]|nr:hypothetical protein [Dehalococcoidia bacterium]